MGCLCALPRRLSDRTDTVGADERNRMRLDDGVVCYSPGDLRSYLTCELATLRRVDILLGRLDAGDELVDDDALGTRISELGEDRRREIEDEYAERYGRWAAGRPGGLALLAGPGAERTHRAAAAAVRLLGAGPDAVAQLPVAAGRLYGAADLLARAGDRWQLVEVRMGLRLKDSYLTQIGALALGLLSRGVALDAEALLVTGNDGRIAVPLVDAMQRAREVMSALEAAIDARVAAGEPVSWDDDSVAACGWCATCRHEMTARRDVRLTAGMRMPDRALLRAAGIRSIDDLAIATATPPGLDAERFETLRAQARLQVRQMPPGTEHDPALQGPPVYEVYDVRPLLAMPEPSAGDVFFDFESDPLWAEEGSHQRGLHYLFGMWLPDASTPYLALWAHDRPAELRALRDFIAFVTRRLTEHPSLHIYHYGSYETVVLSEIALRFGYGEQTLADWIEQGLFVDLLPVVKGSIRSSQPGYGLKKIEPLYMGDELRTGQVMDGAASVAGYQRFSELRAAGRLDEAGAVLDALADYNRYDCVSTLRLREWLRSLTPGRAAPA